MTEAVEASTPLPPLRMTKTPESSATCDGNDVWSVRMPTKALAKLMLERGYNPARAVTVFSWWDGRELFQSTLGELAAPSKPSKRDKLLAQPPHPDIAAISAKRDGATNEAEAVV